LRLYLFTIQATSNFYVLDFPIDQRMHPEQKKIYQSMTPAQKLDVSMKLYQSAKALKAAIIKEQHLTWNEEKIKKKVNEIFLYAGT
jgi:hypothetical protein